MFQKAQIMLATQPDDSKAGHFSGLDCRHRRMDVTESMEYEWVDGCSAHILVSSSIYSCCHDF